MADWKPDIFEYVDYRAYLQDYYDAAKANLPSFSYRYFARRAGLSSPSFLRHVMRGERNITGTVDAFAKGLGLDEEEKRFFELLVAFDQAETNEEKSRAFETISASRRFRSARRIEGGLFRYLSHWYYPAIRELAAREDFVADPDWIARRLNPPITRNEAAEALEVLFELELLVATEDGIERGHPSLATDHEVRSLAIANYHRQMLSRASDSIESVPSELRDFGAMTVCISTHRIAEFKARIHEFRELVFELAEADDAPATVFQFNTQLFPLSSFEEDDE